jgi:hypothetical protein
MKIVGISLVDRTAVRETGVHRATVVLRTETGGLSLRASAELAGDPDTRDIDRALVDDALRQVRQLPEYRAGTRDITIAGDALPDSSRQA